MCEVYLLFYPAEARLVATKDRKTQAPETVQVATCVVADREGPMLLDLWRESASHTLRQFEAWEAEGQTMPLIAIKYFYIRSKNGGH